MAEEIQAFGDKTNVLCVRVCAKLLQLCLTLCDAMDCSPPVSSVHGILQARILEWVAMPFSSGSSQPSLVGYSSWGCKESNTTEWTSLSGL